MEIVHKCQSCQIQSDFLFRFGSKYVFDLTRGPDRDPDMVEYSEVGENWQSLCPVCLCLVFQRFSDMVNERMELLNTKIRSAVDDPAKLPTRGKRALFVNPKSDDDEPRLVQ